MKTEHQHPGTQPPSRTYVCIGCSHIKTIRGQWNTYTGRWLMSFNCDGCGTHQESFVSEPTEARTSKIRTPIVDDYD